MDPDLHMGVFRLRFSLGNRRVWAEVRDGYVRLDRMRSPNCDVAASPCLGCDLKREGGAP